MLTLTQHAHATLQDLSHLPHTTTSTGLQIRRHPSREGFRVLRADGPEPDETVVGDADVRVYLGPVAVQRFGDHELDVRRDPQDRLEFVMRAR